MYNVVVRMALASQVKVKVETPHLKSINYRPFAFLIVSFVYVCMYSYMHLDTYIYMHIVHYVHVHRPPRIISMKMSYR